MGTHLSYHESAERPAAKLWLRDDDDSLIDFSTGYTWKFEVKSSRGATAALSKITSITGAAGSGTEPSGTPNVTITWAAGELAITPGLYLWFLTATTTSLDRVFEGTIEIKDV